MRQDAPENMSMYQRPIKDKLSYISWSTCRQEFSLRVGVLHGSTLYVAALMSDWALQQ